MLSSVVNSQNKWYASCVCHWFVLIPHDKFSLCFFDLSARCGKCPRKELILKQSSGLSTDLPDVPTPHKLHTYIWPSNVVLKVDLLCCYILTATSSCHATVNLLLLVGLLLRISWNTCWIHIFLGQSGLSVLGFLIFISLYLWKVFNGAFIHILPINQNNVIQQ